MSLYQAIIDARENTDVYDMVYDFLKKIDKLTPLYNALFLEPIDIVIDNETYTFNLLTLIEQLSNSFDPEKEYFRGRLGHLMITLRDNLNDVEKALEHPEHDYTQLESANEYSVLMHDWLEYRTFNSFRNDTSHALTIIRDHVDEDFTYGLLYTVTRFKLMMYFINLFSAVEREHRETIHLTHKTDDTKHYSCTTNQFLYHVMDNWLPDSNLSKFIVNNPTIHVRLQAKSRRLPSHSLFTAICDDTFYVYHDS